MENKSPDFRAITLRNVVDFIKSLTIAESVKFFGAITGLILFVGGIGYSLSAKQNSLREDQKNIPGQPQQVLPPVHQSQLTSAPLNQKKMDDAELEALKTENSDLKRKLSQRPSSYVCNVVWGTKIEDLQKKKDTLSAYINWKLNPISPAGYQDYTEEQKRTFVEQAKQHRLDADDIQREIIEVEKNRGACVE